MTIEHWNLYLDRTYQAALWPWVDRKWETLTAADLQRLPHAVDDFVRYSPTDGPIDMVHVPREMPQELPNAQTRLGVYHDAGNVYVFIEAVRPSTPISELAGVGNEDFSCVIPLSGEARGLYFGLNEKGEAIGCVQVWDPDVQPAGAKDEWPFTLLKRNPGTGPSASAAGILKEGYAARCIATGTSLIGSLRIEKRLIASGVRDNAFQFTAARRCYATAELLTWGSPVMWSPRPDKHGIVRLVDEVKESHLPMLHRLDVAYDPQTESGEFEAVWHGVSDLPGLDRGTYKSFITKATLALNGLEATVALAARTTAHFAIPDGWNRLEVLTGAAPPLVVNFQKLSGHRILRHGRSSPPLPSLDEINAAFRRWHAAHEKSYLGNGTWGQPGAPGYCLCHNGIFNVEPYLHACAHLERAATYEQRIRETCARMLAAQRPEGWFPCGCAGGSGEPALGDGGAFTNGSVGEGLALASALFGERRWLDASIRAADYSWYRWEHNQNYAAFALWHLAALQEREPRDEWIAKALYYAKHSVTRDIGLCGAQDGHNYFTGYGNITLKGLARLLQILPREPVAPDVRRGNDSDNRSTQPPPHVISYNLAGYDRAELRDQVLRFTNQMLSRQQAAGLFAGRNRKYLGYHHTVPGLFFVVAALPELAADLEPALAAQMPPILGKPEAGSVDDGLTLALMARYVAQRK